MLKHTQGSIFVRTIASSLALALVVIAHQPSVAQAETADRSGHEIQRIVTGVKVMRTSSATNILLGWGIKQFQSDVFYLGGFAYTGSVASGQLGNYSEGGLMLGYNSPAFGSFDIDVNVAFGAGGGTIQNGASTTNAGGIIINPAAGLTTALSKAVRFALMVGYNFMPNSSTFTGLTVEGQIAFLRF